MLIFKPIYLLLIIPALLGWFAQYRLKKVYSHYLKMPNKKGKKGIEVAQDLMSFYQLNIPIVQTSRQMVNYYNPQNRTLNISQKIAQYPSITSVGIVAHEVEHAVQEHMGYRFMNLRNKIARTLAVMGQLSPLIFMWGVFFRNILFIYVGLFLLFGMVVFALISLPVEWDASNRALKTLKDIGLADQEELDKIAIVLRNAAFTYVIGAIQRIGTFLFILLILDLSWGRFS